VQLDVVTSEGCANSITKSSYIEVHEKPDALFSLSSQRLDILDPTVTVTNEADGIVTSEFTFEPFGDQITAMETDYSYLEVGTYGITQIVSTEFGCLDTISGSLEVIPHYTLYIPNAFTPDENGMNEIWAPQGQSISSYNLTIYNRWDQELFYSASLDLGWNGFFNNKLVPQGTYIYKIETVDVLGEPHEYFGTFSLIR
jgi:gliding motility-associated-like protein